MVSSRTSRNAMLSRFTVQEWRKANVCLTHPVPVLDFMLLSGFALRCSEIGRAQS
jgi:hypothetical protein